MTLKQDPNTGGGVGTKKKPNTGENTFLTQQESRQVFQIKGNVNTLLKLTNSK